MEPTSVQPRNLQNKAARLYFVGVKLEHSTLNGIHGRRGTMELIVEFYKDFDASVLDGYVKYVYAFRVLRVRGTTEELMDVVGVIDEITHERSITLRKCTDNDLLDARQARRAPRLMPGEKEPTL